MPRENVGDGDARVRAWLALGLFVLALAAYFFWLTNAGLVATGALLFAAAALAVTTHTRFCPVWWALRRSTA